MNNSTKSYLIVSEGCDDSTVVEVELDNEQLNTLLFVAKAINTTSWYGCMPRLWIYDKYTVEDVEEWHDGKSIIVKDYIYFDNEPINASDKHEWWERNWNG